MLRLLAVATWALSLSEDIDTSSVLLDDTCGEDGEDCELSLRQLRARGVLQSSWGSCQQYGCHARYSRHHGCQCNSDCQQHGNCCADYVALCKASEPAEVEGTLVAGPGVAGHPDPAKLYPEYEGFTLSLVEEFNEAIDLDTDPVWTWSDGGLSEGQVRFVKEQIQFKDGKMTITAEADPGIAMQTCSAAEVGNVDKKPLVSGEFRARHNLFRYGRYEVRMKAPEVQAGNPDVDGNFISTMFVYRDAKFNHWREIDIEVTGDNPHTVTTNVLSADHTDEWSTKIAAGREVHISGNARETFHTYAFEWLPDSITWYIDGKKVRTKTPAEHPPIPDLSGKIMMNLWIFGKSAGFGGKAIYNNHYPMSNEYDWFRFYKWHGDETYPCDSMSTSCLTADDEYLSKNNPCDGQEQKGLLHGETPCATSC